MFPDRIEVISPGGLPEGVTTKNIGAKSARRNEIVADMFARMDVVEKAGTGIFRIREAMKDVGLRAPQFEDIDNFFKIILFRPKGVFGDVRDNVRDNVREQLTNGQRAVLEAIAKNIQITTKELAAKQGVTERTIHRAVEKLKLAGFIRRVGSDKSGHWEIE